MKRLPTLRDTLKLTGLFGVLIVVGLSATACGTTPTTTAKKPLVRIWRVDQPEDVVKDMEVTFLETNSTVSVSYKQKSLAGYELSALKSLTARTGPDVWSIPSDWLGDHFNRLTAFPDSMFAKEGVSNPPKTADYLKDFYPQGILDAITNPTDGKVYGLPTGVDTLRLYYNPDVFSQGLAEYRKSLGDAADDDKYQPVRNLLSRPPATWSELVDQVKYLTKRDGNTIQRSAIAMGTADNTPNTADFLQLLILQNGGKVVSTDHKNALFHIPETTPAGVSVRPGENALDFLASFANPNKPTYSWNPSMPQAVDAFGQGKVAMVIAFSDFGKELKVKYPRLTFEVTSVPQISVSPLQEPVNLLRFWAETVPSVADTPNAALAFARLEARNADSLGAQAGLGSPLLATLKADDKEFPNRQILTGKTVFKKNRDQFDANFRQMIIDVTQNGLTPSQALDSGAEKINLLLASNDD